MTRVQSFIEELDRRLARSLPKEIAAARLREVQSHLASAVAESDEETALTRFGSPAVVAREIVRQARGFDSKSAWSLSLASATSLAVVIVVTNLWADKAMTETAMVVGAWIQFFAALGFAARCYQTRRWLVLPVAAWVSAGIVLLFAGSAAFPERFEPGLALIKLREAQALVASYERDERGIEAWRKGNPPADISPWKAPGSVTFYVPGLPVGIKTSLGTVYGVTYVDALHYDSRPDWAIYGEGWAKEVAENRKAAIARLSAVKDGLSNAPIPIKDKIRNGLIYATSTMLVLLAFNAVALAFGKVVERRPWRGRFSRAE